MTPPPPPALQPPAPAAASPETLQRVKTQVEQAMTYKQELLSGCRHIYGKGEGTATARLKVSAGGNVKDARAEGVGSGLAVCLERVLKTITIAKPSERNVAIDITVELPATAP